MLFVKTFFLLLPLLLKPASQEAQHPIHVSFTNMEYKAEKNMFHISFRIFADDFTNILEINNNKKVNLKSKSRPADDLIDQYIKKHFRLKFDNEPFNPDLLKLEYYIYLDEKDEAVQVFYSYKKNKAPSKVHIFNSLLFDLYRDQKNLLIFSCQNTEKALKFDYSKPDTGFEIQ